MAAKKLFLENLVMFEQKMERFGMQLEYLIKIDCITG
jgi:hypothetical protein